MSSIGQSSYNAIRDDLFCEFCNKQCKNLNSLNNHKCRCKKNPNRLISTTSNYVGINKFWEDVKSGKRQVWNKGLTKENSESIKQYADKNTHCILDIEKELDDDGKLYKHYMSKRGNAKCRMHIYFDLTFEQYCMLVKQAGIKSSQIGIHNYSYVLARNNDMGGYTWGNCRFVTQAENLKEKYFDPKSDKLYLYLADRLIGSNAIAWRNDERWIKIQITKMLKLLALNKAEYAKERRLQKSCNTTKVASLIVSNPSYTGQHNSQYGKFWITNDLYNSKWKLEYGPLPQGYRRGRVMQLPFCPSDKIDSSIHC